MPIDPSIALGVKVPDQTTQLSSLLNIASTAQQMQGNAQTIQNNAMSLQQRQATRSILSNIAAYKGQDGTLDVGRLQGDLAQQGGDTGVKLGNDIAVAHQNGIAADKAWNGLNADKQQYVANAVAALPDNAPPDLVHKTLDTFNQQFKGQITPVMSHWRAVYDGAVAQGGPQAGRQVIGNVVRGVLPQDTQQTMNTPNANPTGDGLTNWAYNTKPGVANIPVGGMVPGSAAPQLVPRSQQQSVQPDAQNNLGVTTKSPTGDVIGWHPLGSSTPNGSGPYTIPAGETPETVAQAQKIKTDAAAAASAAPTRIINNNKIIQLAETADLGTAGAALRGLGGEWSAVGNMFGSRQGVTDYHQINHYLALEQGNAATAAGFNSDASRAIGEHQVGSSTSPKDALQGIARTNRALETGKMLLNDGLSRAAQAPGANQITPREFRNKWANVIDWDALRLYDAKRNAQADPKGYAQVVQELGGPKSERLKAAADKIDQMNAVRLGQP